jgi:hypothetical protein
MYLWILLAAATSLAAPPFRAPPRPSGSVAVKLYPMENVTPGTARLVTFGLPLPRGSLSDVSTIRLLKGGQELPAFVENLTPWRHASDSSVDGTSVRVARIQFRYTFGVSYPQFETISVEWGLTQRTQSISSLENPRTGWHQVTSGSFVASDMVFEPDVFAVLPSEILSQGVLKPGPILPLDKSILERREDPLANDAIEKWTGFLERDHAQWNNFYSMINQDDARVTSANQCNYKSEFDTWLYDRASSMFTLYMRSGFLLPLREAVRNTDFYKQQLYTGSAPSHAVGIFKLKSPDPSAYIGGNGAMYSYNESLAYLHWLTGDDDVLPHVAWVVTGHENQDEPTRWSPSEAVWTERHTAYRLLANAVAWELTGEAQYRSRMLEQSGDFIWHQDGAGGLLPANRVDGALYHYGRQHGDGTEDELVASSWMTVITLEAMTRVFALTDDLAVAHFIRRAGTFEKAATKTDSDHLYDIHDGPLAYADYMMKWDGSTDERDGDQVEHALEIAWALALAGYFADLVGLPDPTLRQKAAEHYATYDVGVNYWIRPAGPDTGRPAYRVTPWRKYGWEHKPSGGLSWLMSASDELPPRRRRAVRR